MICSGCGANLPENSKFCSVCGAKIEPKEQLTVVENIQDVQNEKPVTIEDYGYEPGHTLPLSEQIKRIQIADDVIRKVFEYIESANYKKQEAYKKYHGFPVPIIILLAVILGPTDLILLVGVFAGFSNGQIILGLGCLMIIVIPIAIIIYIKKKNELKGQNYMEKAWEDEKQVEDIIRQNAQAISYIPQKYRFPLATSYMREMFETGRVQSMNEAMDKYDEYEHRLKMEMSQSAIYAELQAQQQMIADTNAAATIGAAAGALNFLFHL